MTRTYHDNRVRYNVIAYVKGEAPTTLNETVLLMSHMDTVGTSDYGKLQNDATDPDFIKKAYEQGEVPAEVREHALSEDWQFGRGSADMKSGVAGHLYVLKYFAEHPFELKGNVILVVACDEEDTSHGMRSALKDLKRIKEKEGFEYIAAINADYMSARYPGDDQRYIYVGTVGKLLPTFFVAGKETHVGEVFEGLDPNLILSCLTEEIDYNPLLCDEMYGEWTLPPVSLKQTDLKPFYDVQTPLTAFAYYNFFVHSWSPKDVLERLKVHGTNAFERALRIYRERYEICSKLSGSPQRDFQVRPRVYTFEEYYEWLKEQHGQTFEEEVGYFCELLLEEKDLDVRSYACRVVEHIFQHWDESKEPVMIIFYANIYIPRIAVSQETPAGARLIGAIESAVEHVQPFYPQRIQVRQFYPYISDMSYVALSDDEEAIDSLERNMPVWGERYRLNAEDIRALDVPVCNIGPYGFDAHKKYERVEGTYSLEVVPFLTYSVIRRLF
jgi:arginine utilization protein RocB